MNNLRFLVSITLAFYFFPKFSLAQDYSITITIDNPIVGKCYLEYFTPDGKIKKDYAEISGHSFHIHGTIGGYYENAILNIAGKNSLTRKKLNKSYKLNIDDTAITVHISGKKMETINVSENNTEKELKKFRYLWIRELDSKTDSLKALHISNYCIVNKDKNSSPVVLYRYSEYLKSSAIIQIFYTLTEKQQNSYFGKLIKFNIDEYNRRKSQIGIRIPNFESVNYENDTLSFPHFAKGESIVLDFWASWCVPCRLDSKQLKSLFLQYHKKGVQFLSISLDKSLKDWKRAIKNDGVHVWQHILGKNIQYQGTNEKFDIYKQLEIFGIPQYFVVDGTGKILLRALNIEAIENYLAEKFK